MYMHAHNTDTCVMYLVQNETDKHVQLSDRFDFMSFFSLIQLKKKIKQNNGYNDRHIQLGIFKLKWTDVKIQFIINNICGI